MVDRVLTEGIPAKDSDANHVIRLDDLAYYKERLAQEALRFPYKKDFVDFFLAIVPVFMVFNQYVFHSFICLDIYMMEHTRSLNSFINIEDGIMLLFLGSYVGKFSNLPFIGKLEIGGSLLALTFAKVALAWGIFSNSDMQKRVFFIACGGLEGVLNTNLNATRVFEFVHQDYKGLVMEVLTMALGHLTSILFITHDGVAMLRTIIDNVEFGLFLTQAIIIIWYIVINKFRYLHLKENYRLMKIHHEKTLENHTKYLDKKKYFLIIYLFEKRLPFIQQIRDVQIGCVGSPLSSWFMMFAYLTVDLDGYFVISRCAYHVSTFTILYSFIMTTSYASNVYIALPSEDRKKSKLFFGLLHVILGGIIGYLSTRITFNITICLFLVFLSYMFSINSYNYLSVNSFLLCELRWYKWDFEESRGIICHVIRRRRHLSNPSEILNSTISLSSQKGYFQYEDDIQLDQKYYNEYYMLR
ncbi:hypothetical protein GCK72_003502 [Caenorhabditis remanei]|uniref:Uncharacterized protein n=1 Tax=Caenorhabditis remanei TaxID=31234 RepID=A0A6A5HVI1_CAERE|nr:hypothetical protein GCK72_003502 [Caenorhabditis remanei]KAF1771675.1 hypothetical protein GCK72_003502 [Caenorhabditis remanei]